MSSMTPHGASLWVERGEEWLGVLQVEERGQPQVMPGALGLVQGARDRQLREQQQQQRQCGGSSRNVAQYPKVITTRAGIRQINCCSTDISQIKMGPNKTMPSDKGIGDFL